MNPINWEHIRVCKNNLKSIKTTRGIIRIAASNTNLALSRTRIDLSLAAYRILFRIPLATVVALYGKSIWSCRRRRQTEAPLEISDECPAQTLRVQMYLFIRCGSIEDYDATSNYASEWDLSIPRAPACSLSDDESTDSRPGPDRQSIAVGRLSASQGFSTHPIILCFSTSFRLGTSKRNS